MNENNGNSFFKIDILFILKNVSEINLEMNMEIKRKQKDCRVDIQSDLTIIIILIFLMLSGLVMLHKAPERFKRYVAEDGPVEWIATVSLLACSVICIERAVKLKNYRSKGFIIVSLLLAMVFLFGVGEEISWGQRIFAIKSSSFFLEHNVQEEINFHNLRIGSLKINKFLFSLVLGTVISLYLLILPILYRKVEKVKAAVDKSGIPIPRLPQIVIVLITAVIVHFIKAKHKWELLDLAGSMIFLAILICPYNKEIYHIEEKVTNDS